MTLVAMGILACGCRVTGVGCDATLMTSVQPTDTTIAVGQSFTARMTELTCRGTKAVTEEFSFASSDTTVAAVDSVSGIVRARAPGMATVTISASVTHSRGTVHVQVH